MGAELRSRSLRPPTRRFAVSKDSYAGTGLYPGITSQTVAGCLTTTMVLRALAKRPEVVGEVPTLQRSGLIQGSRLLLAGVIGYRGQGQHPLHRVIAVVRGSRLLGSNDSRKSPYENRRRCNTSLGRTHLCPILPRRIPAPSRFCLEIRPPHQPVAA